MPFTTVSRVSLNQGNGGTQQGAFYPEDVSIVVNQAGARGTTSVNAIVGGVETKVLIGVKSFEGGSEEWLADPGHLVALACPPHNQQGGLFLEDPTLTS